MLNIQKTKKENVSRRIAGLSGKTKSVFFYFIIALIFSFCSNAQNSKEPWTEKQLMQPAELANILNNSASKKPIIYSIGPAGLIKNAIDIGDAHEAENLEKLKAKVSKLPPNADIVIYCGCCPFDKCPNIRPAFKLLNEMKFTNHKLLNLPQNLKVDWIDQGYPMNKAQEHTEGHPSKSAQSPSKLTVQK